MAAICWCGISLVALAPIGQPPPPREFFGLGFQLLFSILLFLYVGRWADAKLGTAPWLLVLGVFVGAAAGFYSMYRKLMAHQRDSRKP